MSVTKSNLGIESKSVINFITITAVAITLALTPWVNSDSLIIPKGIILFSTALFLIPKLIIKYRKLIHLPGYKLIFWLSILFILQMVLVMALSEAPFAQEFFGRTGRALGFATYFSLTIVLLSVVAYSKLIHFQVVNIGIVVACLITSCYSIIQRFGYDIFDWVSLTNGIIGTLGNPNFQSSFVAMALAPAVVIFSGSRKNYFISFIITSILLYTLYICESTQGYIASAFAAFIFSLIYLWYKNKALFTTTFRFFLAVGLVALAGMLNRGPLSYFLYKYSVQSRGEMWRTAVTTIKENPVFGVGLDSFGDVSLLYRDQKTANGINEFTDNAHNLFLQFSITGGYILAFTYLGIVLLSLYSFFLIQKKLNQFDKKVAALFASWICFQLQSIISPANISMLVWNFIICGCLIGFAFSDSDEGKVNKITNRNTVDYTRPFSYILLIISLVIMYPWFNADKIAWQTTKTGDAVVAIKAAKMYPESSVRYSRIVLELYKSNLIEQSLDLARSSVKFNPRSVSGWYLIMINEKAPLDERREARKKVIALDPFNTEVVNLKL